MFSFALKLYDSLECTGTALTSGAINIAGGAACGVAGVTVDGTAGVAAGAVGAVVRVAGGQISGCSSCPSSSIDARRRSHEAAL